MHLTTLRDLKPFEICRLVAHAHLLKMRYRTGDTRLPWPSPHPHPPTLALLFNKRSTRTRVAAETAMVNLGGAALFLGAADIQMGVNESVRDTSTVLSSMCDAVMMRCGKHSELEEFCRYSSVPVINALTDTFHPTQILADLLTIYESSRKQDSLFTLSRTVESVAVDVEQTLDGKTVAWVGDGNNVLNSMMVSMPRLKMNLRISTPAAYAPSSKILKEVLKDKSSTLMDISTEPRQACKKANFIVTDTWVSMGDELQKQERLNAFKGFKVTHEMCKNANPEWKFMHCLPRKPVEVSDEVFYDGNRSLVFQEAENRKWTIMAVLDWLLRHKKE